MISEDSKAGEQLYDALAEIIDDHMPDVFDEDLIEAYKKSKEDSVHRR